MEIFFIFKAHRRWGFLNFSGHCFTVPDSRTNFVRETLNSIKKMWPWMKIEKKENRIKSRWGVNLNFSWVANFHRNTSQVKQRKFILNRQINFNSEKCHKTVMNEILRIQSRWKMTINRLILISPSSRVSHFNFFVNSFQSKLLRLVTVSAYVFSVSFAALMLSLYYIFIWSKLNEV